MIKFKLAIYLFILMFTLSCGGETSQTEQQTPAQQPTELTAGNLRSAALNGDLQTVREVIEQGIEVDEGDELDRTALMLAAYNGHAEVVRELLSEGADVNKANKEGRTPIMFAASGPFLETVQLLIEDGAKLNKQDSVEGWTALMYAAAEGNTAVIEILLAHDSDPSLEDDDGETAVDFAENNGHTETATLLRNHLK